MIARALIIPCSLVSWASIPRTLIIPHALAALSDKNGIANLVERAPLDLGIKDRLILFGILTITTRELAR